MIINLGDVPFKAFISVTYPGGICTVSGAGQSYSHSGGGTHIFTVKKKGTYTVSTGISNALHSQSVEIRKLGETKTVSGRLYIFKSGSGLASGYSIAGSGNEGGSEVSKSSSELVINAGSTYWNYGHGVISPAVNVNHASKLYVRYKTADANYQYTGPQIRFGLSTNTTTPGAGPPNSGHFSVSSTTRSSSTTTASFSVLSLSGNQYIKFETCDVRMWVYDIYFEP